MAMQLGAESIRVHLPATLHAPDTPGHDDATCDRWAATCIRLSATHALLEADAAPAHGHWLQLELALPGRRELLLCGTITWSITTSAPALLCGTRDQSLGAHFSLELAPTSRDLFALIGVLSRRRSERQARVKHMLRRAGIAAPIPRRSQRMA